MKSRDRACNAPAPVGVLWLTLCAILLPALTTGAEAYDTAEIRSYASALSAVRQGRLQIAASRIREGLRSVPDSTLLNNIAGALYLASGDTDDADAAWRRVLTVQPDDSVSAYGRGLVALSRRRWDEAMTLAGLAAQHGDRAACHLVKLYAGSLKGVPLAETIALPDNHLAARLGLEAHAAMVRGDHAAALSRARMVFDLHHGGRYAEPPGMLMRFDRDSPLRNGIRLSTRRPALIFELGSHDHADDDPAETIWGMIGLEPSRAAIAKIGCHAALGLGDIAAWRRLGGLAVAIEPEILGMEEAIRMVSGPYRSPDSLWSVSTARRLVALTFDDGPRREPTERIVRTLSQFGVRATFFVTGRYAAANPDVVAGMARAGMESANQSYSHAALPTLQPEQIMRELVQTSACIQDITGLAPAFFRPPGGRSSNTVQHAVGQVGMRACMWTVNAPQAEQQSAKAVFNHVVGRVRPGAVVLMHNGSPATLSALPGIIKELRKKGYEFLTVSQLAKGGT